MNRNTSTLIVIVFLVGASIGIFAYDSLFKEGDITKIEGLQQSIDSLERVNNERLIQLESYQKKYDSITYVILQSEDVIDSLKTEVTLKEKEYENKIDAVSSYKHNELEEFFTGRYN
jgi:hypothetical protein